MNKENNLSISTSNDSTNFSPNPFPPQETSVPTASSKKSHKALIIIFCSLLGAIAVGISVFFLFFKQEPEEAKLEAEETSELSPDGLTNEELNKLNLPTNEDRKIITAYNFFDEDAFSVNVSEDFFEDNSELNEYVEEIIYNFFSAVFPDYKSITFLPDSLENNSFKLKSNTGEVYTVNLVSEENNEYPKISVLTKDGVDVFKYDEKFYLGSEISLTDEEARELFGDTLNSDDPTDFEF